MIPRSEWLQTSGNRLFTVAAEGEGRIRGHHAT